MTWQKSFFWGGGRGARIRDVWSGEELEKDGGRVGASLHALLKGEKGDKVASGDHKMDLLHS